MLNWSSDRTTLGSEGTTLACHCQGPFARKIGGPKGSTKAGQELPFRLPSRGSALNGASYNYD